MKDFDFKCVLVFIALLAVSFIGVYVWLLVEFFKEVVR